ncbi:MAG: GAF domain-containing protein [Bacteroidales bacterium]|nr:GAF domain-containing protein [Bacteroidales bacterium]
MDGNKKRNRYKRIYTQLASLLTKSNDYEAHMATVIAILHHKIDYFFWTGFYFIKKGELIVKMYQGPVACQELKKDVGVCWKCINYEQTIIVKDVKKFGGHITCDSRSKSEIAIPFRNKNGEIIGALDIDSKTLNSFDEIDSIELEKILNLI